MVSIVGTAGRDFIHMLGDGHVPPGVFNEITTVTAGDDSINADAGDDYVHANDGNDTVFGGIGRDMLDGEAGDDQVFGGDGNDALSGGSGVDILTGGLGNDTFYVMQGEVIELGDQFIGEGGTDTLAVQPLFGDLTGATVSGVEVLSITESVLLRPDQLVSFRSFGTSISYQWVKAFLSDSGTIDLRGMSTAVHIDIFGTTGSETFLLPDDHFTGTVWMVAHGGSGNDTVVGGAGTDYAMGDDGDDLLTGNDGNDALSGGRGADTLTGGAGRDVLYFGLGGGADLLSGGSGDDWFAAEHPVGVSGVAETIDGGTGVDELSFHQVDAGLIDISQSQITGVEILDFFNHRILLTPEQLSAFDEISGASPPLVTFSEVILSRAGTADLTNAVIDRVTTLVGSLGSDVINLTNVANGQMVRARGGNDHLIGGLGDDLLVGNNGNDSLSGGTGHDSLYGQAQADLLKGNAGNDFLSGGLGRDRLIGGSGIDTFVFGNDESTPLESDRISDFLSGTDRIDLRGIDANSGVGGYQAFTFIGADAFHNVAGELRYEAGILSGDVNGDGIAEFLVTLHNSPSLAAGDLIL